MPQPVEAGVLWQGQNAHSWERERMEMDLVWGNELTVVIEYLCIGHRMVREEGVFPAPSNLATSEESKAERAQLL